MHDCAIRPFLLEDHLARERCGNELDQSCGAFGE
jgi:hypothetical protein